MKRKAPGLTPLTPDQQRRKEAFQAQLTPAVRDFWESRAKGPPPNPKRVKAALRALLMRCVPATPQASSPKPSKPKPRRRAK